MLREAVDEDNFWTFSCQHFPKDAEPGDLCFMVHSGFVRGYFTILEFFDEPVYRTSTKAGEVEYKKGNKVKLATWRSISPIPMTGFQGWRYTELRP